MASDGKVAIITGAGSGIGKATALAFLNDGYRVAFAGRRRDILENAIKEAGDKASCAVAVPTDISPALKDRFESNQFSASCCNAVICTWYHQESRLI